MGRTSHRLTWRPGVNQRTTRGFIPKRATGAPSLAQHFLNSFQADLVTSIRPIACQRGRAYNPEQGPASTEFGPVHGGLSEAKGGRRSMAIKAEGVARAA